MNITTKHWNNAVAQGILTNTQADTLQAYFNSLPDIEPSLKATHVLYYLGGLIAIGAMTLFMSLGWEAFGGWGIVTLCLVYAGLGLSLSTYLQRRDYGIPAGICAAFVICLTPLALYGLQQALGVWPDDRQYQTYHRSISWHWIYMELGTLLISAIILRWYRYPFLLLPIAVTLWYLSMDSAALIAGDQPSVELRADVSIFVGLGMLLLAGWVDYRSRHTLDYAFWLYLFGTLAFWGGLTMQTPEGELSRFLYCIINVILIGIGVAIARRVFVVFGALGVGLYLGYLAWDLFQDSWLFPVALTILGLGLVLLGILWQKYEHTITQRMQHQLNTVLGSVRSGG